jgi:Tfp pilus assembly protein PilP
VPAEILASATPVEDKRQPDTIKGTLLRNQLYDPDTASKEDKDVDMEVPSVDSLVLTGVLTVGKEHVAILNDGVNDYVVGKGSYVLGVVKVNSVGSKSISLTDFRSSKESKQLELSLQDVGLPGDKK